MPLFCEDRRENEVLGKLPATSGGWGGGGGVGGGGEGGNQAVGGWSVSPSLPLRSHPILTPRPPPGSDLSVFAVPLVDISLPTDILLPPSLTLFRSLLREAFPDTLLRPFLTSLWLCRNSLHCAKHHLTLPYFLFTHVPSSGQAS